MTTSDFPDLDGVLRMFRDAREKTQRDLAADLGLSPGAVGHWEAARPLGAPPVRKVDKVAKVLGLNSIEHDRLLRSAVAAERIQGAMESAA